MNHVFILINNRITKEKLYYMLVLDTKQTLTFSHERIGTESACYTW